MRSCGTASAPNRCYRLLIDWFLAQRLLRGPHSCVAHFFHEGTERVAHLGAVGPELAPRGTTIGDDVFAGVDPTGRRMLRRSSRPSSAGRGRVIATRGTARIVFWVSWQILIKLFSFVVA